MSRRKASVVDILSLPAVAVVKKAVNTDIINPTPRAVQSQSESKPTTSANKKFRITLFQGTNAQWYFHIRARNHKIIAQSEGYKTRASALKTIRVLANQPSGEEGYYLTELVWDKRRMMTTEVSHAI